MSFLRFWVAVVATAVAVLAVLCVLNAVAAVFVADTWWSVANAVMWALGMMHLGDKLDLLRKKVDACISANKRQQAMAMTAQR